MNEPLPPGFTETAYTFGVYSGPGEGVITTLAVVSQFGILTYWRGVRNITRGTPRENKPSVELTLEEFRRDVQAHIDHFKDALP